MSRDPNRQTAAIRNRVLRDVRTNDASRSNMNQCAALRSAESAVLT